MKKQEIINIVEEFLGKQFYLKKEDSEGCYIYEAGMPYGYEGVSDYYIKEKFSSDTPRESISDDICDQEAELRDYFIDELRSELKATLGEERYYCCEDEIGEYLDEKVHYHLPKEYIYGESVPTHFVIAVEDEANHEFTLNSIEEDQLLDGAIKWLIEQQGYSVEEFNSILRGEKKLAECSTFIKSVYYELENITTCTNKLTILSRLDISDILDWNDLNMLAKDNKMLEDINITIPKDVRIGLVDTYNGAGSVIEIELEKEIILPVKYVYDVKPDAYYRYSADEVYGPTYNFWSKYSFKVPKEIMK